MSQQESDFSTSGLVQEAKVARTHGQSCIDLKPGVHSLKVINKADFLKKQTNKINKSAGCQ
jgi:hypothetical protein